MYVYIIYIYTYNFQLVSSFFLQFKLELQFVDTLYKKHNPEVSMLTIQNFLEME